MTLPFDCYPGNGRQLLGTKCNGYARTDYGAELQRITGQTCCAYCGQSLVDTFAHWLLLTLDHVIPENEAKRLGFSSGWYNDYSNLVLTCSGCNGFNNRWPERDAAWRADAVPKMNWSLDEFYWMRDAAFERKHKIASARRQIEQESYAGRPWESRPR